MQLLAQRAENKVRLCLTDPVNQLQVDLLQVLQEELAKYKQQAEKARVQKLQQVKA